MKFLIVFVSFFAVGVNGWFFGGPSLDGLRVKFGLNPFDSYNFDSLPRTLSEAVDDGWKPKPTTGASYFCGQRYINYDSDLGADDPAVMLLFDANGYIAGIQAGIPDHIPGYGYPSTQIQPPMIHEAANRWYTITAYFAEPDVICGSGRSDDDFDNEGTASGLHILNSASNPREVKSMPMTEAAQAGTKWTRSKCFPAMGRHYWYDLRRDMDCNEFQPVFLMYNSGKLNAFGWAFQGNFTSRRYEHPTESVFSTFFDPVPDCLSQITGFSTMHIYLDNSPRTNFC